LIRKSRDHKTRTFDGCLRVATASGPDLVVLDRSAPRGLERLLRAHPCSASAYIMRLSNDQPADVETLRRDLRPDAFDTQPQSVRVHELGA
jgi:hypothetical protein